jgi:cytochrome c553
MGVVTRELSDLDIEDLAAFYAGIRVRVETVPGQ